MNKNESQAISRIRNTRGACYLTHGADNYDHKGLNKARRNLGKAIIKSWEEETNEPEEVQARSEGTTFRIVVTTQIEENYGTHRCECGTDATCKCRPYWKRKGGTEYKRNIGTAADVIALGTQGVKAIAEQMCSAAYRRDRFYNEYPIGWDVIPSTEETYEEQLNKEYGFPAWK